MARFILPLLLIAAPASTTAFCPAVVSSSSTCRLMSSSSSTLLPQPPPPPPPLFAAAEGTDFDAPILANPASGTSILDHEPVVDDECYMGNDDTFLDCVDFDPATRPTRSVNAQDRPRLAPRWAFGDDYDAPTTLANSRSSGEDLMLLSEPIVDDECYLGKDDNAEECVDFDPQILRRRSVLANPKSAC